LSPFNLSVSTLKTPWTHFSPSLPGARTRVKGSTMMSNVPFYYSFPTLPFERRQGAGLRGPGQLSFVSSVHSCSLWSPHFRAHSMFSPPNPPSFRSFSPPSSCTEDATDPKPFHYLTENNQMARPPPSQPYLLRTPYFL